jgi:hypothetical protein
MKYIISIILLALFVLSVSSYAESDYASGTSALSSSASINFVIKIPQSMYVRIGDDLKTSNMRTEENSGQLSARVLGNSGTVLFSASSSLQAPAQNIQVIKNTDTAMQHQGQVPVIYTATMP